MNWQPIETAPKDERILLWYPIPLFSGLNAIFGKYDNDGYCKKPNPYWNNDVGFIAGKRAMQSANPTHWAPIPRGPIDA